MSLGREIPPWAAGHERWLGVVWQPAACQASLLGGKTKPKPELKKIQRHALTQGIHQKYWQWRKLCDVERRHVAAKNLKLIFCLCLNPPNASLDSSGYDSPREGIKIFSQNSINSSRSMERLKKPVHISQRCFCCFVFLVPDPCLLPLGNSLYSQKRRQPAIAWGHPNPSLPFLYYKGANFNGNCL